MSRIYAKISNNAVAEYPYNYEKLKRDNPQTSWPRNMSDEDLIGFGVYYVEPYSQPAHDYTQKCIELAPGFNVEQNRWEQQWQLIPATEAEMAASIQAIKDDIVQKTQEHLDEFAQTRQYDNILSACTYANSPTPKFAAEGLYCIQQRDATWAELYKIMSEVEAEIRPVPASFEEIVGELPVLAWPN
jgi:hypothetical protein